MNWASLDFGVFSPSEIKWAVNDDRWQRLRKMLKGKPLTEKFKMLKSHLRSENNSRKAKIQVTNYVNALRRAGQIPPRKKK